MSRPGATGPGDEGILPIVLEDASFAVRGVTVLDRVTLTVECGQPLVVVGPNGAGKTTLLRLCMGLIRPTSGRITFTRPGFVEPVSMPSPAGGEGTTTTAHGTCDSPAPQGAGRVRAAIVFQRPVMLRRSTAANLRYALAAAGVPRAAHAAHVDALLTQVGLKHLADRPARKLSGGEQQKLALARALARDPQVLFLDEPTASLDPAATQSVETLIRDVAARGIKVVMATHDLGAARRLAGAVVLMHRGRVVEMTDAAAFFTQPKTEAARRFVAGELLV
jgi:tungstate transport system ATP-binding protein